MRRAYQPGIGAQAVESHAFFLQLMVILLTARLLAEVAVRLGVPAVIGASWRRAVAIGVAMVPRGEVGLIFAELGRVSGVFDNELYAGLIIVITLAPPLALRWFYKCFG